MKTPDLITDVVAPLGPNTRAILEERPGCGCGCGAQAGYCFEGAARAWPKQPSPQRNCTHQFGGVGVCVRCGASAYRQPSPRPTVLRLLADTKAVILRRRQECYGGLAISDEQADELSRALVQNLLGSYEITGVAP